MITVGKKFYHFFYFDNDCRQLYKFFLSLFSFFCFRQQKKKQKGTVSLNVQSLFFPFFKESYISSVKKIWNFFTYNFYYYFFNLIVNQIWCFSSLRTHLAGKKKEEEEQLKIENQKQLFESIGKKLNLEKKMIKEREKKIRIEECKL